MAAIQSNKSEPNSVDRERKGELVAVLLRVTAETRELRMSVSTPSLPTPCLAVSSLPSL